MSFQDLVDIFSVTGPVDQKGYDVQSAVAYVGHDYRGLLDYHGVGKYDWDLPPLRKLNGQVVTELLEVLASRATRTGNNESRDDSPSASGAAHLHEGQLSAVMELIYLTCSATMTPSSPLVDQCTVPKDRADLLAQNILEAIGGGTNQSDPTAGGSDSKTNKLTHLKKFLSHTIRLRDPIGSRKKALFDQWLTGRQEEGESLPVPKESSAPRSGVVVDRMSDKKRYEITTFAPALHQLLGVCCLPAAPASHRQVTLVDIGAGQGYLCRAMQAQGGKGEGDLGVTYKRIVGVERDSHQTKGFAERNQKQARGPKIKKKKQQEEESSSTTKGDQTAVPLAPVVPCDFAVEPRTSASAFLSAIGGTNHDAVDQSTPSVLGLCSLHACGSLSADILRLHKEVSANATHQGNGGVYSRVVTVNVGCCYNLLQDETDSQALNSVSVKACPTSILATGAEGVGSGPEQVSAGADTATVGDRNPSRRLPLSDLVTGMWSQISPSAAANGLSGAEKAQQSTEGVESGVSLPLMTYNMKSAATEAPVRMEEPELTKPSPPPAPPVAGAGIPEVETSTGTSLVNKGFKGVNSAFELWFSQQAFFDRALVEVLLVRRHDLRNRNNNGGKNLKFPKWKWTDPEESVVAKEEEQQKESVEVRIADNFWEYYSQCRKAATAPPATATGGDRPDAPTTTMDASTTIGGEDSKDAITAEYMAHYRKNFLTTVCIWALRSLAGQVAETLILVDRCHYVEEGGNSQCMLIPVFDPRKSPRAVAIVAVGSQ